MNTDLKKSILTLVLLLTAALGAFAWEKVTIQGTLNEYEADEEGNVISVWLETEDDNYLITPDAKSKPLNAMVGQKVKITGWVTPNEDDYPWLRVESFEPLKGDKNHD